MKKIPPSGPSPSTILIVGEVPGKSDEEQGLPFSGGSGQLLTRLLSSAGISRQDCRLTNVIQTRPPLNNILNLFLSKTEAKKQKLADPTLELKIGNKSLYPTNPIMLGIEELNREIERTKPKLIIPLGDVALWATIGISEPKINSRAGSIYQAHNAWVVPTLSPAKVLSQMSLKNIVINDLKRAKRQHDDPISPPAYNFHVLPTFPETIDFLQSLLADRSPRRISCDIETTSRHEIGCVGFGTSATDAFCLPYINEEGQPYWSAEDQLEINLLLRQVLRSDSIRFVGQNFSFDYQYLNRDFFVLPRKNSIDDTMVGHHLCYPGTPKGLDYLSRLYLPYHVYWKDEGKFIDEKRDLRQWYEYNCKDCCSTLSVWERIEGQIDFMGLKELYEFQMDMWRRSLFLMLRGVKVDQTKKAQFLFNGVNLVGELEQEMRELSEGVIPNKGKTNWWNSPTQSMQVFYELLKYPVQLNKKTKKPSVDDAALTSLRKKDPLLWPIIDRILAIRSLNIFNSTFLSAGLGQDGRLRCSYDVTGTETFRLASRKDAFGGGVNLQTIPRLR